MTGARTPSSEPDAMPLIRLRGITKVYGTGDAEVRALRGIDMKVSVAVFQKLCDF